MLCWYLGPVCCSFVTHSYLCIGDTDQDHDLDVHAVGLEDPDPEEDPGPEVSQVSQGGQGLEAGQVGSTDEGLVPGQGLGAGQRGVEVKRGKDDQHLLLGAVIMMSEFVHAD